MAVILLRSHVKALLNGMGVAVLPWADSEIEALANPR